MKRRLLAGTAVSLVALITLLACEGLVSESPSPSPVAQVTSPPPASPPPASPPPASPPPASPSPESPPPASPSPESPPPASPPPPSPTTPPPTTPPPTTPPPTTAPPTTPPPTTPPPTTPPPAPAVACSPIAAAPGAQPNQGDVRVTVTLYTASGKPAKGICVGVGPVVVIFLAETGRAGYAPAGQDGQAYVDLINEAISQTLRYFKKDPATGAVTELGSQPFKGPVPGNTYAMPAYTLTGLP